MLINYAFPHFASLRKNNDFHLDANPAHYSSLVRTHLRNERLDNRIREKARSSDQVFLLIDYLPFFLQVHLKEKVCAAPRESLEDL